ncbi:MAG: hypothetical protein J7L59_02750 [Nanoarchaeota archaeon]|nr:hypothetical protein [Nanoarchaeota archaeon]
MSEEGITWEKVKSFDDIVLPEERRIISDLEREVEMGERKKCPFLRKKGNFFYFCQLRVEQYKRSGYTDEVLSSSNPAYLAKVDVAELQLRCLDEPEKCDTYAKKINVKKEG